MSTFLLLPAQHGVKALFHTGTKRSCHRIQFLVVIVSRDEVGNGGGIHVGEGADEFRGPAATPAGAPQPVSCGVFLNPMGGWDPRFSESMDLTTEFQTFRFSTKDTFVVDMDFELLFQFGSEALSKMGEVTIEFQNMTIYQMSVQ